MATNLSQAELLSALVAGARADEAERIARDARLSKARSCVDAIDVKSLKPEERREILMYVAAKFTDDGYAITKSDSETKATKVTVAAATKPFIPHESNDDPEVRTDDRRLPNSARSLLLKGLADVGSPVNMTTLTRRIAAEVGVEIAPDTNQLSAAMNRLIARGFVEKHQYEEERYPRYQLTPKGYTEVKSLP